MDSVIGIRTNNFSIIVADSGVDWHIIRLNNDDDKIHEIDSSKLLAVTGDNADRDNFASYIKANTALSKFRNRGRLMSVKSLANFIRTTLSDSLRTNPVRVDSLVTGYDETGYRLYSIDYFGTLLEVDTGSLGYASRFVSGILDKEYNSEMSLDSAMEIVKKCISELRNRMIIDQKKFICKILTNDGIIVKEL